jgi:predicted ABC-type ATPase
MEPWFWIIAGHNGAGKSTLSARMEGLIGDHVLINPDQITDMLMAVDPELDPDSANLQAAQLAEARVDRYLAERLTFVVETVLSSDKYASRIVKAKARGLSWASSVALSSADLAVARVANRHAMGGHTVPEDKIRSRRQRSKTNAPYYIGLADVAYVFCNDAEPALVAMKENGTVTILDGTLLPEFLRGLS